MMSRTSVAVGPSTVIIMSIPPTDGAKWLVDRVTDTANLAKVGEFLGIAEEVGCSPSQLALAWTASNPNVSSVIIGARRVSQLEENLGALEVMDALIDEQKDRIDQIFS